MFRALGILLALVAFLVVSFACAEASAGYRVANPKIGKVTVVRIER